jgi:hypothetical protein
VAIVLTTVRGGELTKPPELVDYMGAAAYGSRGPGIVYVDANTGKIWPTVPFLSSSWSGMTATTMAGGSSYSDDDHEDDDHEDEDHEANPRTGTEQGSARRTEMSGPKSANRGRPA